MNETKVIQKIVLGSDWKEVITNLVAEENMDPLSIDLIKLVDVFTTYLQRLKDFDFRVPARFILVAAILLRMKCELLLEEEEKKRMEAEKVPPLNIEDVPVLSPPIIRKPTRKVTLSELVNALNKAMVFKERKEEKKIRLHRAVERLIEPEEDIELKIKRIHNKILKQLSIMFSDLVPVWKRKDIVNVFLPLLYLETRGLIVCEQDGMFKDIHITIKEPDKKDDLKGVVNG